MPHRPTFPSWLGTLFGHSELEVRRLLEDESSLHFLVAWSLFESKCFSGFVKAAQIEDYARVVSSTIDWSALSEIAEHFHTRYQNSPKLFKNLMHHQKDKRLSALLATSFSAFTPEDGVFFLVFVIYRYRNNIFHGNKGVLSWLSFREQIQLCIQAMQVMVSHAESLKPTMSAEAA